MSILEVKIRSIIRNYPNAYISGSGQRTIEAQIAFVKERPSQYPTTLKKLFDDFNLDKSKMKNEAYLKTVYQGKDEWLKKVILDLAKKNAGFQHLSGNAIDVSVKKLSLDEKERLKQELDEQGYHVIMESVSGHNSKYNVSITQANVFHIDLLTPGRKPIQGASQSMKFGSIYMLA